MNPFFYLLFILFFVFVGAEGIANKLGIDFHYASYLMGYFTGIATALFIGYMESLKRK